MDHYFRYEEKFLCITARDAGEKGNLADMYGFQFDLKPDVINEIAIVCPGDFQNVIYNAYCCLLRGEDIKEYVECFVVIPTDADRAKREKILANARMWKRDSTAVCAAGLYRPRFRAAGINCAAACRGR